MIMLWLSCDVCVFMICKIAIPGRNFPSGLAYLLEDGTQSGEKVDHTRRKKCQYFEALG